MRAIITNLFGTYTPVTYTDFDGNTIIPNGASGVDWTWIAGVFLFGLTLYCILRILGGAFKK